jgi:6-phospho-3-hexuloisomerase
MLQKDLKLILGEIETVLSQVNEDEVSALAEAIVGAKRVVTAGAGRVGLATKGFAMRLGHLGLRAYALGDMTVPGIGKEDLLLVASGSGETPTIAHIVEIAKKSGARVALLTANRDSRMGKQADLVVLILAPSKTAPVGRRSAQPMTTLNEQCLSIFFDALVLQLMNTMGETHETMWARHSNLE